ncbi:hypothetical protein EB796_016642 [Bugula neritina]|uniref:Uncharacterized protein n=1 Tax=Bugula neritina TaxID=10212 RepID=A0A7J7JFZ1_BUGNE|nr:hypothetical protein EB796_016642 [Bugula neritina]
MANTKEVTDKNATIQEMQRKLNDLESSSINLQCSVKEKSLDLIDENGVEHSSPGSIATNLEDYMKLQLVEKDNSIEELERRLESVQVANEIYQDQVNELKSKLDGVSESVGSVGDIHMKVKDVSAVAGTPAEQLSDDERELYSALDDLLTKCRMSGGSGDSPAMDHIPPNVFSFSEYSAQTLNASSKVRNLHYRDVAPVSMANSSTQCSGYDLPKPSVSHTSSQYDAVLLHNQSVQVSTNLVSVEVQASLAGCKCSTVISDSVNAACQTQGALDSHVIKCDAGCQITQGATESQVTQGATDCQTTQGATECQTTQGATDCQTTQGAAECQATQGATECQTTQGARGCNEVESNCQNLEHLQHIPTDSSLEQLCQLRDVKDSPLRADTEILHDSHLLDTNLELQDYFIQLPLSCVGVEENHNVACSVCKSRTTLVPVADVATQTDVQSGDGIALGVILSDLQVSLENTSHALSTYNSAGNFTYNASLANEKITSDDELFGNVLHKSDGVVCPDTRLIPTFLSTTSCQKGTQATLYEVEGKPRLATSCDWMIICVLFIATIILMMVMFHFPGSLGFTHVLQRVAGRPGLLPPH